MSEMINIAKQCLRDEADAILKLIDCIDDSFVHAVELLYGCKGKVVLSGVGKSGHIAAKLADTLSSTGTPAFFLNPLDVFHGSLGAISKDDIVILISHSGRTAELLRFIPFLQQRNIPVIGMSGDADSDLAQNSTCHICIHIDHEACPLNLAPTSSTTATLAMGDALASALISRRNFKADDFAQYHPGGTLGRRLLCRAKDVMRTNDLPTLPPDMTLGDAILPISQGRLGLGIVMKDNLVLGIITDGDVRRATERLRERFFFVPVTEVMTSTPVCVLPDMRVIDIIDLLQRKKIHAVLVKDEDGNLLGIVDNFACYE